jgi:hypothetical protein
MSEGLPVQFPANLPFVRTAFGGAATAAAVLAVVATVTAQDTPAGGLRPSPEMNPPGREIARATTGPTSPEAVEPITPSTPAAKGIQDLISRAVTDATSTGKRADLIGLLAQHDRDRLAAPANGRWHGDGADDWSDVDAAAVAFQNAWQARFGLTFRVDDKVPLVFTEPSVHVSGLDDAGPPPEGTTTGPSTGPATAPAGRPRPIEVTVYEPGRRRSAVIRVAHEGTGDGSWHMDLPDSVTAATLHDSLLRHLNAITANQARWPTDVDQAYIYVAEHALSSVAETGPVTRR